MRNSKILNKYILLALIVGCAAVCSYFIISNSYRTNKTCTALYNDLVSLYLHDPNKANRPNLTRSTFVIYDSCKIEWNLPIKDDINIGYSLNYYKYNPGGYHIIGATNYLLSHWPFAYYTMRYSKLPKYEDCNIGRYCKITPIFSSPFCKKYMQCSWYLDIYIYSQSKIAIHKTFHPANRGHSLNKDAKDIAAEYDEMMNLAKEIYYKYDTSPENINRKEFIK